MIETLIEIKGDEGVPELCARLGEVLGLDVPVPEAVLWRATDDADFAANLLTSRGSPAFLEALFDAPATHAYEREAEAKDPTNRQLVGRAASALVRWGRTGFSTVDEEVLARRERACLSCPHLKEPAARLQQLIPAREADRLGARTGGRVCDLCGCNVGKKMRLPSESCPGAHPDDPSLTRWEEPRPDSAAQAATTTLDAPGRKEVDDATNE